ncbi:MAG TPA: bifunctional adenosylcobinamide kinase/adenosylcobinamide-phosphate guanylyltransferase [Steroidobacteraceae bacterium]|nr:bifunctional adenosylcobinamide kinase/adenosylcobinamide-phosphate guanylyltransferase [Steroidobacteraceae bacterium]
MPERHLILGGARSGKTNHAITLATRLADERRAAVTYVATAQALDHEMRHRIDRHREQRPASWRTVEAPSQLASALSKQLSAILLVDCLTLWLSNALLLDFDEAAPNARVRRWDQERSAFLEWLARYRGVVLLVSNEVGSGIVPASALARRFQDEQGRLNQDVAALCDSVTLVVAGIAVPVKPR